MRSIIFYGQTGKFTFRMLATVLGGESICILLGALVARAIAATDERERVGHGIPRRRRRARRPVHRRGRAHAPAVGRARWAGSCRHSRCSARSSCR